MGNTVTLTFAGDAKDLQRAAGQAEQATDGVAKSVSAGGKEMQDAAGKSSDLTAKVGHLGSAMSGAMDAIDATGAALQSIVDLQQAGAERASRLARAINDVEQAQLDLKQAFRDGQQAQLDAQQAQIDLKQANQDAAQATQDYADAVKEHGKNSLEAKQALIDLEQAQQDAKQATEDGAQAAQDAAQATQDAKSAQLDLNDAQREAHPPDMQKWADQLNMITPIMSAVVGILGLVTAAQWLWNASLWASPVTWIVLAIAALVAIIVIIATKTSWFQDIWNASWGWIKRTASDVWEWLKKVPGWISDSFSKIADYIKAPFRAAFNFVADAWNHTLGALHWSVPSWVPGIGGNSISVPHLPKFHTGGVVPGSLGSETLAVLQAGELVSPAGGGGHAERMVLGSDGSDFGDFLIDQIRRAIERRGGDPGRVLGNTRG